MREIIIDDDTRIYFIYEEKKYYIENKSTTTYRTTAQNAKAVLDIVAPSNTVTLAQIEALSTTYETLTSLSYTWADNGSYLSTIQLNDFKKYPFTLDTEKGKLYIMNTELIFDLTTNEDKLQRLSYIRSFYYTKLGLDVSLNDLGIIYDTIVQYYSPTPYVQIVKPQDNTVQPKHNNILQLSNFNSKSPAVYSLTCNPRNKYTSTTIAYILSLQDKVITLTNSVPSLVHVGDVLTISNAITYVENNPYYADGNYTVTEIGENTITVNENFPTPYVYTPPVFNVVAYKSLIEEVSREDREITVTDSSDLDAFLIGDVIHVQGTTITTEYETLTVDGAYTIQAIGTKEKSGHTKKVITVEETPPTNYTYTTGTQPYIYKRIAVAEVNNITSTTVTLASTPTVTLTNSDPVSVLYPNGTEEITAITNISSNVITVADTLTNFVANYGLLTVQQPSSEVLIRITDSTNDKLMPNTSFIVDTKEEANSYLSLLPTLTTPDMELYNEINEYVEDTYDIEGITGIETMSFLGLYSEVYSEGEQ